MVDGTENKAVAARYGVQSYPTLIIFKNGAEPYPSVPPPPPSLLPGDPRYHAITLSRYHAITQCAVKSPSA